MGRQCQLQTAAVGQIAPTNDGEGGGLSTPLHEPPPPSLPPQVATEHEIEEKRTQPGGAEPARQPPPPPPPHPPPRPQVLGMTGGEEGTTRDQGAGGAMSAAHPPPPPPLPPPPLPQALTRDVTTGSKGSQTGGPSNEESQEGQGTNTREHQGAEGPMSLMWPLPPSLPPPPSPQAHIGELATGTDDERREGHLREDQGAEDTMSATQPPPPPLPPPPHPQALTRDVATDSGARQEDL